MADEPAPEFEQSTLPGVATMLAALVAGKRLKGAVGNMATSVPDVVAEAGTPLSELAEFTRKEVEDLTSFAASRGVTANMVAGDLGKDVGRGSYFDRAKNKIGIRRGSVPEVMHEIGHATPIGGSSSLRNVWQNIATVLGGKPGDLARALLIANALSPDSEDSDGRAFASDHAPGLIAATYAPELIEESRATAGALMGARRFGPGVAATARQLLPHLGTYAAHAASPVLGTLLAQKVMEALRNRGEEKKAEVTAGKEVQSPGILRAPASSAWHMGVSVPKPKSIKPNSSPTARAKETPKAKPPSKTAYFSDVVKTLNNPQRGFRQAKIG
jgi:hypothetical protein